MLRAWFRCVRCNHVWRGSVVASLTYSAPPADRVETPTPIVSTDQDFDSTALQFPEAPTERRDTAVPAELDSVDARLSAPAPLAVPSTEPLATFLDDVVPPNASTSKAPSASLAALDRPASAPTRTAAALLDSLVIDLPTDRSDGADPGLDQFERQIGRESTYDSVVKTWLPFAPRDSDDQA